MKEIIKKKIGAFVCGIVITIAVYVSYVLFTEIRTLQNHEVRIGQIESFLNSVIEANKQK